MKTVNVTISRLTNNLVGSVAGAVAGYYVATKMVRVQQNWMTIGITIVGAIVGAGVQANMTKKGAPTASVVTAPTK
jgi:outer membrane lipoprotein SlyB